MLFTSLLCGPVTLMNLDIINNSLDLLIKSGQQIYFEQEPNKHSPSDMYSCVFLAVHMLRSGSKNLGKIFILEKSPEETLI